VTCCLGDFRFGNLVLGCIALQGTTSVGCSYASGMPAVELITCYRVSTPRYWESGLGIEAQRAKLEQLAA